MYISVLFIFLRVSVCEGFFVCLFPVGFFIQFNLFCVGFIGVFVGFLNFNLFDNFISFL